MAGRGSGSGYGSDVRILVVCTANICRSASAAALLRDAVAANPELAGVEVRSAGTHAIAGAPGCHVAPALAGRGDEHRSRPLTAADVEWADLVLTAEREHRSAVASLQPTALRRVFTLRQAGRAAQWLLDAGMVAAARERAMNAAGWADGIPEGDPRRDVEPMPANLADRWGWVLGELDAARGMVSVPAGPAEPEPSKRDGRRWRRRAEPEVLEIHADDVPDPHVHGMHLHQLAYETIIDAVRPSVELLSSVAAD